MPMKLYADPNKYLTKKVLVTASYAGLDIEVPKGGGGAEEGRIPVLETDQGCIFSTSAIARYLARLRRDLGLYGQTLLESGAIDSWTDFCTHELEVPLGAWLQQANVPPAVVERAKGDVSKALTVLDNHLLHFTFMAGDQITLADISVCCTIHNGMSQVLTSAFLSPFGNLRRWFSLCMAQPEFAKVLGKAEMGSAPAASKAAPAPAKKEAAPAKKEAAPKKEAAAPKPAAAPASSGGAVDDAAVKAVGDAIRELKEKLKAEGLSGKKVNEHEEVKALVAKLSELKAGGGGGAAPKAEAKKGAAPKADAKKGAAPKADAKKEEDPVEARKKKMKKVLKEGGKRGVEIEGAADMGGLQFFCTNVEEPEGDLEMMEACMTAMNEKSDPTEEERKGGSGNIGKMIFSCCTEHLGVLAYVPEHQREACSCEEWMKKVLSLFPSNSEIIKVGKDVCIGKVNADGNNNIFPLKIREPMILEANNFLRKLGLFPEDNGDSDDEMVFGDDDFPSM